MADLLIHVPNHWKFQGSGDRQGCTPANVPLSEISTKTLPTILVGYNPQESLENTINTMGTLLGVHSIVP